MSWKDQGYDEFMRKKDPEDKFGKEFISGEQFDARLDATSLERFPLRFFTQRQPLGKPGVTYYDTATKKAKIFISDAAGYADLNYTTTSSSTSSSTSTT
jgi:hypothetical protein